MNKRHPIISALALMLMSTCTDATGVEPVDLAGTWTATSIVYTGVENAELSVDVTDEGVTLTLVLGADETFTQTVTEPGLDDEIDTGTYGVAGTNFTLSDSLEDLPDLFTIARDGDTVTLTISEEFEFTNDVPVAATLVITLTR
jgi:hypothetical protein